MIFQNHYDMSGFLFLLGIFFWWNWTPTFWSFCIVRMPERSVTGINYACITIKNMRTQMNVRVSFFTLDNAFFIFIMSNPQSNFWTVIKNFFANLGRIFMRVEPFRHLGTYFLNLMFVSKQRIALGPVIKNAVIASFFGNFYNVLNFERNAQVLRVSVFK